jgi:hypothetical protein
MVECTGAATRSSLCVHTTMEFLCVCIRLESFGGMGFHISIKSRPLSGGETGKLLERAMPARIVLITVRESNSDALRPLHQLMTELSLHTPAMASFAPRSEGDDTAPFPPYPLVAEYTLPKDVQFAWGADPFVASDGRKLLPVAQQNAYLGLYDLETGAITVGLESEERHRHGGPLACCHVYPARDGSLRLAVGGWCPEVVIYSLEPDTLMRVLHDLVGDRQHRNPVWCIQSYAGPEGEGRRLVLLGGDGGSFEVVCGETGEHIRRVGGGANGSTRNLVVFHDDHDRPRVLCAGRGTAVEVYDPESGEVVMRTEGGGGRLTALTILDPGTDPTTGEPAVHAIASRADGRVQVWALKGRPCVTVTPRAANVSNRLSSYALST